MNDTKRDNPPKKRPHTLFYTNVVTFCPALKELRADNHILKNINHLHITGSGFILDPGYPEGVEITIEQSPIFNTEICVTITSDRVTLSPLYTKRN